MVKANTLFFGFMYVIVLLTSPALANALSCNSGMEPVLKIEYQAEDHMYCEDPRSLGLPASTPWGINKSVLYQSKHKKKRVDTGQCVVSDDTKNGLIVYKNKDFHHIDIQTETEQYSIDMPTRHGSVSKTLQNDVNEVKLNAFTKEEYAKFEKMQVLPDYRCGIIPPLEHDPTKMTLCVTEISNMNIILYSESTDILSKHVNWYKAKSLEWICPKKNLFDPPSIVNLVKQ